MREVKLKLYDKHDPYKDTPYLPFDDHGWGSTSSVFASIIDEIKPKTIIEVGSWKGASARHMAKICVERNLETEIICVDTWLGSHEHWECGNPLNIWDIFRSNIVQSGYEAMIIPIRLDSVNACHLLNLHDIKAEMVYIDAGHEYESIKTDIYIWWNLLKSGGIILIDDSHYEPIRKAVAEIFGDQITEADGKYFIKKA